MNIDQRFDEHNPGRATSIILNDMLDPAHAIKTKEQFESWKEWKHSNTTITITANKLFDGSNDPDVLEYFKGRS